MLKFPIVLAASMVENCQDNAHNIDNISIDAGSLLLGAAAANGSVDTR